MEDMNDIIAEMRMGNAGDFPFAYMIGDPDTPEVVDITTKAVIEPRKINIRRVTISDLADRLESAWKREKRGNSAAMREALVRIIEQLKTAWTHDPQIVRNEFNEVISVASSALSAPARNCDRFADEDDAFATWHDSLNDGDVVSVRNAFRWLFATAAERKGEGDGSK